MAPAGHLERRTVPSLGRDRAEGGVDRYALPTPQLAGRDEDAERDRELEAGRHELLRAVQVEQVIGEHEVEPDREVEEAEDAADRHHRDPREAPVDGARL